MSKDPKGKQSTPHGSSRKIPPVVAKPAGSEKGTTEIIMKAKPKKE